MTTFKIQIIYKLFLENNSNKFVELFSFSNTMISIISMITQ